MHSEMSTWCLEGYVDRDRQVWRTMIHRLPFQVGRGANCDLVLPFGRVSHKHAELFARRGGLWLRDLNSTNGTFLNGKKLHGDGALKDGDIVHFADHEFRLVSFATRLPPSPTQTIRLDERHLPSSNFDRVRDLRRMLDTDEVRAVFQPLVSLADDRVMGYEVLGRGQLAGIETPPTELFYLAEAQGLEQALSEAFRNKGIAEGARLPGSPALFVNSHPAELADNAGLLASLADLRQRHPQPSLILEIHESAVADISALQDLSADLEKLDIGIAFDDFGTGQARLLELTDVSPEFVKFDRMWVKNLHRATHRRLEMVQTLTGMVTNMEIATIAEGIESEEEAAACRKVGFDYAQGYYFGRPAPVDDFA